MTAQTAQPLVDLPALRYECGRCGLLVSHESDKDLVRSVVLNHVLVAHRRSELGSTAIRWDGFLDQPTVDRLLVALVDEFKGRVDLWVDDIEASFENYRRDDTLIERFMAVVARFVGTNLTVIDRR